MLPLAHPSVHRYVNEAYHSDDLHTLYLWLEAHGYHYYGTFGAEQFGRFVCEELALGDVGPTEHTSVIEIALNGTVVPWDTRAQHLLNKTVNYVHQEGQHVWR